MKRVPRAIGGGAVDQKLIVWNRLEYFVNNADIVVN